MTRNVNTLVVCIVVVLGGACGDEWDLPNFDLPARDDSPIQTDTLEYTLHPELVSFVENAIVARTRYTNSTNAPVFFARCLNESTGPVFGVVRAAPDSGPNVVDAVWACVGGVEPGVVEPGAVLDVVVPLGSSVSGGEPPITMRMRTGLFRVTLKLSPSRKAALNRAYLPIAERQSNVFEIHPPD